MEGRVSLYPSTKNRIVLMNISYECNISRKISDSSFKS